jgi:radical SAM superfamily enzyme
MAFVPALPEGRDRNGDFLFPFRYYTPRHESWPYTPADFKRVDESPDFMFYATPRYTTYLDPQAIEKLRAWYSMQLPHTGRILDLCASSRSYYPYQVEDAVWNKQLEVLGIGMNLEELRANSVLQTENSRKVHDLNKYPNVVRSVRSPNLKAVTCALGIEYLTAPLEVLKSLRACMVRGAKVHIVVSNTCAWQKAIVKWKAAAVEETLRMVRGKRYSPLVHRATADC